MIKHFYLALEQKLLAITDEQQPTPLQLFKHCDLWNRQVEFIEQETPFQTPAVFVELSNLKWSTCGNNIQEAEPIIRLHIVTPWNANTAANISNQSVRNTALAYLDIPSVVFRQLQGQHGNVTMPLPAQQQDNQQSQQQVIGNFNALTRIESVINHNHERFIDSVETYQCHIKDFTFSNPTFPVDVVGLSIEFDPHPGQQS